MKLYFSAGACSLAAHIALEELGLPHTMEAVDLRTKRTRSGADFNAINPKGYVPALELDDGSILTEGTAILQYLADQKPAAKLAPANGTLPRYRLQEWLGFINSELHKNFSPLFNPEAAEASKALAKAQLARRLAFVEQALAGRQFLLGDGFTVADAYLYTLLGWTTRLGVPLDQFPALQAFKARIGARPAVKAAEAAEQAR
jgi:glutathione S-transferase